MGRNVYFSQGTNNEQFLLEDLIIESISIYGSDFFYIPALNYCSLGFFYLFN